MTARRARAADPEEKEFAADHLDVYADSFTVQTQLFGQTLQFGVVREDAPPLVKVTVKVSPQMAKVMGLLISKHIRQYEEQTGKIGLPNEMLHDFGLEEEIE